MAQEIQVPRQKEYCGHWDDETLVRALQLKQQFVEHMQETLRAAELEIFYIKWEQKKRKGAARADTVKAHPDWSGAAPTDSRWMAYDESTYDGAPDAGKQIVGWGSTADEALANYDTELAAT